MAQLHILLVFDTDDQKFHMEPMSNAPTDSDQDVWDPATDEWRELSIPESALLYEAEAKVHAALTVFGLFA